MNKLDSETTHPTEHNGGIALPGSLLEGIRATARLTNATCFVIETSTFKVLYRTSGIHHIDDTDYIGLPWHTCNPLWPQIFKEALGRLQSLQENCPLRHADDDWDGHICTMDCPIDIRGRVFHINLQFTPLQQDGKIGLIAVKPSTCKQSRSLLSTLSRKVWEYDFRKSRFFQAGNIKIAPKEMMILGLAKGGWSTKYIANRMNVSIATIKTYRARIFKKLGVYSITEALASMDNYHLG